LKISRRRTAYAANADDTPAITGAPGANAV
jgi:hypothetical protein